MLIGTVLPVSGDLTEDIRVMFSNPYIFPMTWGEALLVPQVGTAARVGDSTSLFEGGDTSAYVYDPDTNGYIAVTSSTPGFTSQIEPGQGFFVKFSDIFLNTVAQNAVIMHLQLPLSK